MGENWYRYQRKIYQQRKKKILNISFMEKLKNYTNFFMIIYFIRIFLKFLQCYSGQLILKTNLWSIDLY